MIKHYTSLAQKVNDGKGWTRLTGEDGKEFCKVFNEKAKRYFKDRNNIWAQESSDGNGVFTSALGAIFAQTVLNDNNYSMYVASPADLELIDMKMSEQTRANSHLGILCGLLVCDRDDEETIERNWYYDSEDRLWANLRAQLRVRLHTVNLPPAVLIPVQNLKLKIDEDGPFDGLTLDVTYLGYQSEVSFAPAFITGKNVEISPDKIRDISLSPGFPLRKKRKFSTCKSPLSFLYYHFDGRIENKGIYRDKNCNYSNSELLAVTHKFKEKRNGVKDD